MKDSAYAYASGQREAHRQEKLKQAAENPEDSSKSRKSPKRMRNSQPWSEQKAKKELKVQKREKRAAKKEYLRKVREGEVVPDESKTEARSDTARSAAKEGNDEGEDDGWEELQRERKRAKLAPSIGPVTGSFDDL